MKIEPIASEMFEVARVEYASKAVPAQTMLYLMAISQAVSLKRIADRLDDIVHSGKEGGYILTDKVGA